MLEIFGPDLWRCMLWTMLGFVGVLGVIAVISPRLFTWLSNRANVWVDSEEALRRLDRRIEVDHFALKHCRLFGALIVGSLAALVMLVI